MFDPKQYQEAAKQFQKMFSTPSAPAISIEKINQLNQDFANALADAGKTIAQATQKFVQIQSSFAQEQMQKFANIATKAISAKNPEESIQAQAKFAQEAFDANIQNIQDSAKSASKTAVEVIDIVNKKTVGYINEVTKSAKAS